MNDDCSKCLLRSDQKIRPNEIPLMTQYIPFRLVRSIGEMPCCFFERKLEQLSGVVVYFDIVGFTPIVANHVNSGLDIGILSDIFRQYYSIIIDTIKLMGGSVFQFAGDSILVCFEKLYGESELDTWNRALSAMHLSLVRSNAFNAENSGSNGFILDPKIGIGFGPFYQILLGDRTRFITPVIAGDAVDEAVRSESVCNGHEIVIGRNAFEFAQSVGMGDCFTERNGSWVLEALPEGFTDRVAAPIFCDEERLFENPRYYNRINAFINPMIQQQIKTHFQGFLGEYREITCVMVRFEGKFTRSSNEFNLVEGYNNLNTVYEFMQDKAIRFGGFCTKPDLSDKGTVIPVLFGAPTALENKERNAMLFVEELLHVRENYPFISSITIGIATGDVYCGEFGGYTRKDYSVVGSTINFAARLMMMPEHNSAYLDEATRKKTEGLCDSDPTKKIFLKGFSAEQSVFRYIGPRKEKKAEKRRIGMVGREEEFDVLMKVFKTMLGRYVSFCPIIGDAGMGKSYLVENFLAWAIKEVPEVSILSGSCYQYEETTLFFPWRAIIKSITGITDAMNRDEVLSQLSALFHEVLPDVEGVWIPYFLNMLGFDFDEDDSLKEIDVGIKQERFFAFVYKLLMKYAQKEPVILVIEDIHWSDAVSLRMLEYIMNGSGESYLMVIPVSRESDAIMSFFRNRSSSVLNLKQLKIPAARKLASLLLNMDRDEDALIEKIVTTSDCNPFFIENIVQNMIESGVLVESKGGKYFLSKDIKSINIPSSIQNIILSRLNSLLFEEQVVFKTASVIGRTFLSDILRAMVPDGISEYIFENALENFETHNLILREDERRAAYYFKHITIRDVVYNTILESTRKELNLMLLAYLENRYADSINSVVERLEYHAGEAESWPKVYQYALLSAVKSEKQFSNLDAIVHYMNALNSLRKITVEDKEDKLNEITLSLASAYRKCSNYDQALELYRSMFESEKRVWNRAAILQGIGQCYQEQGKFDDAVQVLEEALSGLGERAPKKTITTYLSIAQELVIQIVTHFLRGNRIAQLDGEKRLNAEMKADILCVLQKLYYFGKTEKIAWASVVNYNNVLKIASSQDKWCMAVSNYAVTLVSGGFTKLGLWHFKNVNSVALQSRSRMANSIYKSRYAYYFLFYNQPQKSIELLEDATNHFRSIGEMWELMTAVGALAQNYFLITELDKAERSYLECEKVARKLNSPMHIGWAYNKVPFIRYLQGKIDGDSAISMLVEGIAMSESVQDHMTLCIHYGHLAFIAVRERRVEEAVEYAEKILRENHLYTVNIPHVKISYVNAVEALCFAAESSGSISARARLFRRAEYALGKAIHQGKSFHLITGPALRAASRIALCRGQTERAQTFCMDALAELRQSPYEWEYANTLMLAARCFPDERATYLAKAELVFAKNGIRVKEEILP